MVSLVVFLPAFCQKKKIFLAYFMLHLLLSDLVTIEVYLLYYETILLYICWSFGEKNTGLHLGKSNDHVSHQRQHKILYQ